MEGLVKGDIIVIEFTFSNLKESKRRPVFIIKNPRGSDVIVNQITGASYQEDVEIPLRQKDFKQGSLKRDSFLRLDKIGSIENFAKSKFSNKKFENSFVEIELFKLLYRKVSYQI